MAVDFDGVLNTYVGWAGEGVLYEPADGAWEFLYALASHYRVVIFTTRDADRVWQWLRLHRMADYVADVTNGPKPPAVAYVDDRAVRFEGDYRAVLEQIEQPTHWEDV